MIEVKEEEELQEVINFEPLQPQPHPARTFVVSPQQQRTERIRIGIALHALVVISVVLVFIWLTAMRGGFFGAKDHPFNWHPMLMVLAFGFLESEAIMAFAMLPFSHKHQKLVHILLHSCAIASITGALSAVFIFHDEHNIADLYSLHSWCGFIVFVAFVLQYVVGFGVYVWPGAGPDKRASFTASHRGVGIAIYLGAIMTMLMGFLEKQTFLQSGSGVNYYEFSALYVNVTALCFPAIAVLVCVLLYRRHTSQRNSSVI